jgi:hypothetical protein
VAEGSPQVIGLLLTAPADPPQRQVQSGEFSAPVVGVVGAIPLRPELGFGAAAGIVGLSAPGPGGPLPGGGALCSRRRDGRGGSSGRRASNTPRAGARLAGWAWSGPRLQG